MKNGQTNIKNQLTVTTRKVLVKKHIVREGINDNVVNFDSAKYWEERYVSGGNSGNGSYGFLAEYKKDFLNQFILENKINSLLEYGCGDCNQLSMIECENIIGVDVSKTAVDICQSLLPNSSFIDLTNQNFPTIKTDLLLSLDVIYHLIEDDVYETYMRNIINHGSEYLIIYSANFESNSKFANHVRPRKFTNDQRLMGRYTLKKHIRNIYSSNDHTKGSFSDWYIFNIKNQLTVTTRKVLVKKHIVRGEKKIT